MKKWIPHHLFFAIAVIRPAFSQYFTSDLTIEEGNPQIHFKDSSTGHEGYWIHANSGKLHFIWDQNDDGNWSGEGPWPLFFHGRKAFFSNDVLYVDGDTGRVAVGTNDPSRAFQVTGTSGYVARFDIDSSTVGHDSMLELTGRDSNGASQRYAGVGMEIRSNLNGAEDGDLWFTTASASDSGQTLEKMRLTGDGNLGIGTTSPKEKLQIGNGFSFHDGGNKVIAFRSYFDGGWKNLSSIKPVSVGENSLGDIVFGFGSGTTSGQSSNLETKVIFKNSGNVGIGTTNPSHKLSVNGTICAKEVIVESDWSDYVFEKDYYLAPLSEVEAHIEANGHLPGIPSASEIEAKGAKLSELVTLQMAKIEELTLHLIEKEKQLLSANQQLEKQSTDLADLRRSNTEILERLSALEK